MATDSTLFLPEESHGQRILMGYSPWHHRVRHDWSNLARMHLFMSFRSGLDGKESSFNVEDLGSISGLERFPGQGNGYHSNIPAWRILRTEEPGGLHTVHGVTRVWHD